MGYRDDREALHNRVNQLEQELDDARREGKEEGLDEAGKRAADLEKKVGEMRGELEKMELELQAMRGASPPKTGAMPPNKRMVLALAGVSLACAGMGVAAFMMARPSPPPPPIAATPTTPKAQPYIPPADTAAEPEPTPTPTPPAEIKPSTPARTTTAKWSAKVTKAEGLPIAVGDSCSVEAKISSKDTNAIVPELSVMCGTHKLYRNTDQLNGMGQMDNDAREVLGAKDNKSVFTISYRDIGTRTGERTQVDLDSRAAQGFAFKETIPRFRVEFSMSKTSAETAPLAGADQRMQRAGKITEASDNAPVKPGASCVVRAMPIGKGQDCAAEIKCGATTVVPSTEMKCAYDATARPTKLMSTSVPKLSMPTASTLTIDTGKYSATITLD